MTDDGHEQDYESDRHEREPARQDQHNDDERPEEEARQDDTANEDGEALARQQQATAAGNAKEYHADDV